jgi:hypothetical protein
MESLENTCPLLVPTILFLYLYGKLINIFPLLLQYIKVLFGKINQLFPLDVLYFSLLRMLLEVCLAAVIGRPTVFSEFSRH